MDNELLTNFIIQHNARLIEKRHGDIIHCSLKIGNKNFDMFIRFYLSVNLKGITMREAFEYIEHSHTERKGILKTHLLDAIKKHISC